MATEQRVTLQEFVTALGEFLLGALAIITLIVAGVVLCGAGAMYWSQL